MLPDNHYNVVLKNASGLYIGVPSKPFSKIIGLSKLDRSFGDDIDALQPNQIGLIYTNYDAEELTLKRIYTIGHEGDDSVIDVLTLDSDKLYILIASAIEDFILNNPI